MIMTIAGWASGGALLELHETSSEVERDRGHLFHLESPPDPKSEDWTTWNVEKSDDDVTSGPGTVDRGETWEQRVALEPPPAPRRESVPPEGKVAEFAGGFGLLRRGRPSVGGGTSASHGHWRTGMVGEGSPRPEGALEHWTEWSPWLLLLKEREGIRL